MGEISVQKSGAIALPGEDVHVVRIDPGARYLLIVEGALSDFELRRFGEAMGRWYESGRPFAVLSDEGGKVRYRIERVDDGGGKEVGEGKS